MTQERQTSIQIFRGLRGRSVDESRNTCDERSGMNLGMKGRWPRGLRRASRSEQGGLLLEVVVSLSVFVVLGTAVLSAVQISYIGKRHFEGHAEAENIIRRQLDYVWEQAYKAPGQTYLSITPPAGYSVMAESLTWDSGSTDVSTVRLTVNRAGQQVKVFETLRSNR